MSPATFIQLDGEPGLDNGLSHDLGLTLLSCPTTTGGARALRHGVASVRVSTVLVIPAPPPRWAVAMSLRRTRVSTDAGPCAGTGLIVRPTAVRTPGS